MDRDRALEWRRNVGARSTIGQWLVRMAVKVGGGNPATPEYWVRQMLGGGLTTAAGVDVTADKALSYSAVWAAINIISGTVGMLPFVLYERLEPRGKTRVPEHGVYQLLHTRPNEHMDALTFRATLMGHVLAWGNGYAEIEFKGNGKPHALWPLRPDRVTVEVTTAGRLIYRVSQTSGPDKILFPHEVLHIKGLGFDGLRGYSVIQYAAQSLGLALAAEEYGATFFANSATPSGVLQHPGGLSPEAAVNLRRSYEDFHKGSENAHRTALLEEGVTWQQVGIPPEDAQLLMTRQFQVNDVARWYNIPPHMLAELTRATFSNIEHQGMSFVTFTIGKWLKLWEHESDYKLLSEAERRRFFSEFVVDALLRGDTKTRYQAYHMGRQGGWFSVNDVRELENMNPVEGGDVYLQPVNMQPLGADPDDDDDGIDNGDGGAGDDFGGGDDANRALLVETWGRIATKELRALAKALKTPRTFDDTAMAFYSRLRDHVRDVLGPVLAVCAPGIDARTMALKYVDARRGDVWDAWAGIVGEGGTAEVRRLLERWVEVVPEDLIAEALGEGKEI